jgi:hypothetical protein
VTGIFTDIEIITLAVLSLGYVDSSVDLLACQIEALDHLDYMGFCKKSEENGLTKWVLVEVPPMAESAVTARRIQIRQMAGEND